jgi:hypothetical protein
VQTINGILNIILVLMMEIKKRVRKIVCLIFEKFASYYPHLSTKDLAEKFCAAWKMYGDVVGVEFVERGLKYITR